VGEIVAVALH